MFTNVLTGYHTFYPPHSVRDAPPRAAVSDAPPPEPPSYLAIIEGEDPHVASVVDMIPTHHRIGMILHPDSGQQVPTDLIVLVHSLGVVGDVEADILTVGDVTVPHSGLCARAAHTHGGADRRFAAHDTVVHRGRALVGRQRAVLARRRRVRHHLQTVVFQMGRVIIGLKF